MTLSKSIVLTLIVVAGLAAGTVLVAGYGDKPNSCPQGTCQAQCDDCPLQGTDDCCKAEGPGCGACAKPCASACGETACANPPAGCCPQETPVASQVGSGCGGCPMGGCPRAE
jgi:hypothetical protein